jgi:trans-2,3-dihydro-3-hydroxyanthranilate isomerase
VVLDADDLAQDVMQRFARETRLSETTFVQRPTEAGADYRNRIFMTTQELPFAGHPSLGTAVAVAVARGKSEAHYVQQTGAGLQPVDVRVDGRAAHASILQEPPSFGPEVDAAEALAALGLDPGHAHVGGLPPQVVSTGLPPLIVPVQRHALARARPDHDALAALLERHGATTVYLVAWEPGEGQARTRSFFVDVDGITEDPATGSAAGPLLAYLNARAGMQSLDVHQGVEMGRASLLRCRWEHDEDRPRVGGDVVVLAQGTVHLP